MKKKRMKTITNTKKLFIALLLSLVVTTGYSQHNATEGTEFYVTFVNNNNLSASTPGLTCQIRYVVTEACTITAQYGDGSYLENNAVYAPGVYTLETDKSKSYYMGASGTSDKMIKISSTKNISVFALSMSVFSSDATTILPITTLGNKYTILSNIDMPNYGGHIAVIAPTPGTTFTIRRPDNTAVLSNQNIAAYNQPYFYFEDGSNQDFTGYTVESNHNVAVFSTKICGNPAPGGGCDHNFEQMFPANTAGKEYLLWSMSPIYQSSNPAGYDSYRVVALENSTTITRRIGAATTTILLNENEASSITLTPSKVTNDPYAHNSSGVIQFTSNNPFLVEHILGHAPCVKWISPVEQRVTSAVLTPFIPIGNSVIEYHQLHVMIPSGSQGFFTMKETRGGISQNVDLTFYTNITNQYYTIAYKEYAKFDDVLIELSNPAGLIAYMAGYGQAESYLFTAGVSAFNLQTYYTITTKTTPFSDVYYTDTEENTHTFVSSDNITLKRTIEKPFTQVQWLVNGTPYSVTENTNTSNTVTIPASVLSTCGSHTISMSVRYSGATADSLYTGTVWLNIPPVVSVIASSSAVCSNTPVTFTATVSGGSTSPMTYSWNIGGVAATTTSNTYVTTLTTTSTYSVSITNSDGCTSGFTAPQTITVIAEGVTPTITISASDNNICAGTSVIYTSNISNGGSSPGYQWLINEVAPVTGSTGSSYTYTPGNGDEITCVLTSSDPSACSGSVTSNKITMTVTPTANPSVTIHAMPD